MDGPWADEGKEPPLEKAKLIEQYAHPTLKTGDVFHSYRGTEYIVKDIISYGSFGDVYLCENATDRIAMISERRGLPKSLRKLGRMWHVLTNYESQERKLRRHKIKLFEVGEMKGFNFITLQVLGPDLRTVRKLMKRNFTRSTALYLCTSLLRAIGELHKMGFVHRGISLKDFCIGSGIYESQIFMVGLGNSTRIMNPMTKKITRYRYSFPYTENWAYAPRCAHKDEDIGMKDDLESWIYTCSDIFKAGLPWQGESREQMLKSKQELFSPDCMDARNLLNVPREFIQIIAYLDALGYEDKPDYQFCNTVIYTVSKKININLEATSPDWVEKLPRLPRPIRPKMCPVEPGRLLRVDEENMMSVEQIMARPPTSRYNEVSKSNEELFPALNVEAHKDDKGAVLQYRGNVFII